MKVSLAVHSESCTLRMWRTPLYYSTPYTSFPTRTSAQGLGLPGLMLEGPGFMDSTRCNARAKAQNSRTSTKLATFSGVASTACFVVKVVR